MNSRDQAREQIIICALRLAYADRAYSGRETTSESASLDHAQDMLDEALSDYVAAENRTTYGPIEEATP